MNFNCDESDCTLEKCGYFYCPLYEIQDCSEHGGNPIFINPIGDNNIIIKFCDECEFPHKKADWK